MMHRRRIIICNQPYIEMFGLSPDVAKPGCTMHRLIQHRKETGSFDGDVDAFCNSIIRNVSLGKGTRQLTEAPGGRAIEIVNRPLKGGGWVATIEDITPRKRAEEKIAHLAHYDALTDLPNRALFREKLEQALRDVKPGEQLAVLYIDIDEFKSVNDALGHAIGDELLKAVAEHLRNCLNETDVAARLGGDEFAVIQTAIKNRSETTQLVERIHRAIRAPFDCNGHLIATDASIGIALAPGDGSDLDQLLEECRPRIVRGQGRRTADLPVLRGRHGRARQGAARPRARTAPGDQLTATWRLTISRWSISRAARFPPARRCCDGGTPNAG